MALLLSQGAHAQTVGDNGTPGGQTGAWTIRVGALGAFYDSGATIKLYGETVPGASARASDGGTVMVDVGYDVTRNVSIVLMGGFPPKPGVTGEGTVSSLGLLGKVRYGAAILTGIYHFRDWGRIQPYVGLGPAYAIILHPRDGSVLGLGVGNNFGFAFQAGVEYPLDPTWGVFIDVKKVFLAVDAGGHLANAAPVTAGVTLNPMLVSTGISVHL